MNPLLLSNSIDILIDNALKAMKEAQTKILRIRAYLIEDSTIAIKISDTGKGITDEILPKLFIEPIPKEVGDKGLGIGCTLAAIIIQTYGGMIKVSETSDKGTEITINLPIISTPSEVSRLVE